MMLSSESFKDKYRTAKKYFTRHRVLSFPIVMMLIIQKSMKSIQLVLNEFLLKAELPLVSSSAFTQARSHLSHKGFIELNQKAIVEVVYGDDEYEQYQGFRMLAIDGSKVYLPVTAAIITAFGGTAVNQHSDEIEPFAMASVMYDVLNRIAVDSQLAEAKSYEVDLALTHLAHTQANDLLLFDRNYPSYRLLAALDHYQRHYLVRCSRSSFSPVRRMFEGHGPDSQLVTLTVPASQGKAVQEKGWPERLTVRLVRVWLANGEMAVLLTSLLDETTYPTSDFGWLYSLRWGEETFYDLLKNRLTLENFSGKTVEAVKQDFYATIYLSGLESLLTQSAQDTLDQRSADNKHPQQVNRAVSFNAIKQHAFDLLSSDTEDDRLLDKLTQLFLLKPNLVRKNRSVPRNKPSTARRLRFHRRFKKICF